MPKNNIDYKKTIIYKLVCNYITITDLYVGSTTDFIRRKQSHKNACNNETNKSNKFKIYNVINKTGGWNNWSMILIENYPCNNGNEARAKERYYIEMLQATLNMKRPIITRDESKEQMKNLQKEFYEKNKEKLKEFYQLNKEKHSENSKEYYEKNKERLNKKSKEYHKKIQNKFMNIEK